MYVYKLCPNLKHVLFEVLLLLLAITEPFQNQLTEVREVDETFPENTRPVNQSVSVVSPVSVLGDIVRNIHNLLFSGVQSQHLHGWMQVLQ